MGGADSEIGFSSRNILIEAGWFDPISVRRTSKALGLRTEASYRFERGADPEMAELASRRTAELIQQVAGGEILAGVVDVYPHPEASPRIQLSRGDLLRVMGADVPDSDIEEILGALGFHPARIDANRGNTNAADAVWQCEQPSWRRDVARGIDLIEEVARHYGYDKFPPRLPPANRRTGCPMRWNWTGCASESSRSVTRRSSRFRWWMRGGTNCSARKAWPPR
jgi:phenylalanyl-tRNA synthetase beta chain